MSRLPVALLVVGALPLAGIRAAGQATSQLDGATRPALDSLFAAFDHPTSPGCALGVLQNADLTYARGYGLASLEHRIPIDEQTVFEIGSVSKQFTAAAIGLLALDGRLSLDDDIRKYLPELPTFGMHITIRHLLTHTSGLRDYIDLLWYSGHRFEDVTTEADALALLKRQRALNFPPGEEFRYSNTGYLLAGIIVRRVTGQSLPAFARDRIFTPLGMRSTQFVDDHTAVIPNQASSYEPRDSGRFARGIANWEQVGSGGVQTTVTDLARWEANFSQFTVGGQPLAALLQQPGQLRDGTPLRYGLGLFVDSLDGLRRIYHEGERAGYRAALVRYPERQLSVIVLCNVASANALGLGQQVAEVLLRERPTAAASPRSASTAGASPETLHALSGNYYNRHLGLTVEVRYSAGALTVAGLAMTPVGSGQFTDQARVLGVSFDTLTSTLTLTGLAAAAGRAPFERTRAAGLAGNPNAVAYVGRYESPELGGAWIVRARGDTLVLEVPPGVATDLEPLGGQLYSNDDALIKFTPRRPGHRGELSVTNRGLFELRLRRVQGW